MFMAPRPTPNKPPTRPGSTSQSHLVAHRERMRAVDFGKLSRALQLGMLLLLQVESVHLGLASDPEH
jgi:hypothetical protein